MIPGDHPTFTCFCGHDKTVKQNRSAQRGSTPMCHNVPQPMDNPPPTHPPKRADPPWGGGGYLHFSQSQGKPRQTPPRTPPPCSINQPLSKGLIDTHVYASAPQEHGLCTEESGPASVCFSPHMFATHDDAPPRSVSLPVGPKPKRHLFMPRPPKVCADFRSNTDPFTASAITDLQCFTNRALLLHNRTTLPLELGPLLQPRGLSVDVIRNTGLSKAVYNICCVIVGAGVLALPATLVHTHWYGLIPMLLMGWLLNYTGQCMAQCALQDPAILTYRDLGDKAFGFYGQAAVLSMQLTFCIGPSILFLVLIADNLELVLLGGPGMGTRLCLAACLTLPICFFRTFDDLGWTSLGGLLASVIAIVCVVLSIAFEDLPLRPQAAPQALSFRGLVLSAARSCFAFAAHGVFPGILRVMRRPDEFPAAIVAAFSCAGCIYLPFSALCYYTFTAHTQDNIFENLPMGPLRTIGVLMITAHVTVAFSLMLNPVFYLMEEALGIEIPSGAQQTRGQVAGRVVTRSAFVGLLVVVALVFPDFGGLMNLIGGTVCIAISLVMPLAFYLKLQPLPTSTIAFIWAVIAGSCLLSVLSTAYTLSDMLSTA